MAGLAHGLDYASSARFFPAGHSHHRRGRRAGSAKLAHSQAPTGLLLACGLLSGACAYASTWFLMRYFKKSEIESLRPFGYYCLLVGVGGLLVKLL